MSAVGCSSVQQNTTEYTFEQRTFVVDTSFVAHASINNTCPCKTTFTDLSKLGHLQPVTLEDMAAGKYCHSTDAEHRLGDAYTLSKVKGVIYEIEENSEYVAKIHLTKDFEGKLPNGQYISMKNLTLKDAKRVYPGLEYGSRDCSDYWNYNNDTVNFYFKVDRRIRRYPIDEAHYLNSSIEGIDIVLWCYKIYVTTQEKEVWYERPPYAPFSDNHMNIYVWKRRRDFRSKLREIVTLGTQSNYDIIKLGRWKEYLPDHELMIEEIYNSRGDMTKKVK
ncbi:MAG TPA: hypothetical protein VIN08_26540 [Ohtaekwangia sp.]